MRLAIASPNQNAYSETFIRTQLERLPSVLRIYGGPIATETEPGGPISCHGVRGFANLISHGLRHGFGSGSGGVAEIQRHELKRRLHKHGVDVLLANYGPVGVKLKPVCDELSIPLVVHFHGYDAHVNSVLEANQARYEELGRYAARIVVVSEHMAEKLSEAGIPSSKMRLVRYGVEPSQFREKTHFPEQPLFVGVGRFVDKKAPNLTVLAFNEVRRRFPKARLVMIGDGVLLESTRNLAFACGLANSVAFLGVQSREEVARWMREATAFVQHSVTPDVGPSAGDSEGTPVSVLESMMTGLPAIASRHAGIGEVLEHGRNGFLFEERDVKAMSEAMMHLASSPNIARSVGRAARVEALERFSAVKYAGSLHRILESAARREDREASEVVNRETAWDRGRVEASSALRIVDGLGARN